MSTRPPFAQISSYQEFAKYYWYREELQKICKSLGIASSGMKTELCRNITLGDLLDIYYGKKTYAKYDNSALQWNRFVKDFCADPTTNRFPDKLKTAAALWRIVRESTMEKKYTSELLEKIDNQ